MQRPLHRWSWPPPRATTAIRDGPENYSDGYRYRYAPAYPVLHALPPAMTKPTLPPLLIPTGSFAYFALCIDHGTTMMTPTSPPKRLPFVPLQLITTTPHVRGLPTRGVNSHTNGNVSQRAIAWLKNVQESNNAGARKRDQPKPVARPLKRLGGGTQQQ